MSIPARTPNRLLVVFNVNAGCLSIATIARTRRITMTETEQARTLNGVDETRKLKFQNLEDNLKHGRGQNMDEARI